MRKIKGDVLVLDADGAACEGTAYGDTGGFSFAICARRFRRRTNTQAKAASTITSIPPSTPPTIPPIGAWLLGVLVSEDSPLEPLEVAVEEGVEEGVENSVAVVKVLVDSVEDEDVVYSMKSSRKSISALLTRW